ncbi:hypothetical protein Q5425_35950 [Amycolatopsis sp. A133]|uniref:hypothetical protein n=1 Tax=Amycolatopsis sp. A133 TaxID=3064472 RepID=UPI0027FF037B|nr:hypothetical protein [Amycolatopsis sp. A133]MDQ7809151.1 hypothetical protein [Amycolatopsis sp. A133]
MSRAGSPGAATPPPLPATPVATSSPSARSSHGLAFRRSNVSRAAAVVERVVPAQVVSFNSYEVS